uniref:hypothetical protein n=1 Tax=uncultured Erythrobacter sp. TaxID=263913 RepID=UPI0026351676|nr:hypothetical protein [uncultured Erythrobacter sp.]
MLVELFLSIAFVAFDESSISELNLTCAGGGIAQVQTNGSANAFDNYGNSITITSRRANLIEYQSTVDFSVEGGIAKLRLPKALLPPLRGGKDGWFKVKKFSVDETTISGKASVNFLNNPEFSINRITGILTVNSKNGSFAGECQAFDKNAPRKF